MTQLSGTWTCFQIEAEYDSFESIRIVDEHNRVVEQLRLCREQNSEYKQFMVGLSENYDCDSDSHKYGTPCRSCSAEQIIKRLS